MPVQVSAATDSDLIELAEVAALTFPLACPPSAATDDIDDFIAATLSPQRFGEYLADPDRVVLTAVAVAGDTASTTVSGLPPVSTLRQKTAAAANMRRHGMAAAVPYTGTQQEAEEQEFHNSRAAETELLAQFYN